MRFLLTLTPKRGSILPVNYQYPLSAWIYKCINKADSGFAAFLHEQGYRMHATAGGRPFKFFTFSRLDIPKMEIFEDRLILRCEEVYLTLSFLVEQAAEKFITGVFQHQHAGIGDKKSQVDFEVSRIEARPVSTGTSLCIRTVSPVVVSRPYKENGRMKAKFLSPEEDGYKACVLNNLIKKYESYAHYTGHSVSPEFTGSLDWQLAKGPVRSRLITVKAGTPQQTKVRGYDYVFEVSGPEPLMRIGLLAGFGEKNSLGFGCGEVVGMMNDEY